MEDQQEGEAENELFNLEEEFIFQGPEGQEGFLPQGPNGQGGFLPHGPNGQGGLLPPQGPNGQGGAGPQGYVSLSPEPQPGGSREQRRMTPRQFLQNVSNLTQPLRGLNLSRQEAESSESSDSAEETFKQEAPDSSPEPKIYPEVDYQDLSPNVELIPTAAGPVCVLQDQNFSVINVPIEVMRDHPSVSQSREPRGPDLRRALSSTPKGASSSKAKPTRLAEKAQSQDNDRTVTRAQSKADKQSGSKTRAQSKRDASHNAINFNIQDPATQNSQQRRDN